VRPVNIQWSLCYNFIHVYFIKFSIEKIGLNTILTSQFQTYLFPTFIIPKFLTLCSWFTINPIKGSIVSKWNLSKIWIYFLMFSWKIASFLTWYFFGNFFCILCHDFTLMHIMRNFLQFLGGKFGLNFDTILLFTTLYSFVWLEEKQWNYGWNFQAHAQWILRGLEFFNYNTYVKKILKILHKANNFLSHEFIR